MKQGMQVTLAEVKRLLGSYLSRKIDAIHWHHSVRPGKAGFGGLETLEQLTSFHQSLGLADTAQHLTVAPDGSMWLGRDWNSPPASAAGYNGNATVGPFMLTLIGNFDAGNDQLEGAQRDNALAVTALIQQHFDLTLETLRFHNQLGDKTCPGSSLDYKEVLEKLSEAHKTLASRKDDDALFTPQDLAVFRYLEARRGRSLRADPADAELPEEGMTLAEIRAFDERAGGRALDKRLSPEMLAELRPYVINLSEGQFSSSGRYQTSADDVDRIVHEHLTEALEQAKAASMPVVFYAHGGLVPEDDGLWRAYQDVHWWRANGVYPIYFVWETGLFDALARLLREALAGTRAARFDLSEATDWLIERFVRATDGERIWSAMKRSAEQSVVPEIGGAHYTAKVFAKAFKKAGDKLSVHALGHSAGSIFHSYFLPELVSNGIPVKTAHLLAPAVRIDTFKRLYWPHMATGKIEHTSLFTMSKMYELADTCLNIYQKSLLYLIHHALESEPRTPILGLEESLRADPDLRKAFGLLGQSSKVGDVFFARTRASTGRSASHAVHHGDFNDDVPTMNSVLRRVLDIGDRDEIVGFPETAARSTVWPEREQVDALWNGLLPSGSNAASSYLPPSNPVQPLLPGTGKRRALCVGINSYPESPLFGCVADANLWAQSLQTLGFETRLLLEHQASRSAIMQALEQLLASSSQGDVVVFQFAGHGTYFEDRTGDEDDAKDEALCPIDSGSGAYLIDDDIAQIFAQTPAGVSVTCFLDCCHSGTSTRVAVGRSPRTRSAQQRTRFLPPTPTMLEAHQRFRAGLTEGRSQRAWRGPDTLREVVFSACQPYEEALETNGQGDFTLRATQLLASGVAGLSNQTFQERVTDAFGSTPQQHPHLDCAPANLHASFLLPAGRALQGLQDDEPLLAAVRLLTQALEKRQL